MSDTDSPTTDSQTNPTQPDGKPDASQAPAVTDNKKGSEPATDDNKTVTLKESDYKNLISQRDRANNQQNLPNESEEFLNQIAKEREIDSFLSENKDKFPDVKQEDLMFASDPEELESLAGKQQRRIDDAVQQKLLTVQKAGKPELTPEEKAEQLKQAKKTGDFDKMLELQAPKGFLSR